MEELTETCIRCGKETEVPVETPVEKRNNYVEGSGQMCKECYEEVYGEGVERINGITNCSAFCQAS